MKEEYSIGEMAKRFNIAITTLRYYDEIGLFKPHYVNEESAYRYYHIQQFESLNTILHLKTLGVPLKDIRSFYEHKSVGEMIDIMEKQLKDTQAIIESYRRIEHTLENHLEQLQISARAETKKVAYVEKKERMIVELVRHVESDEDMDLALNELERMTGASGMVFTGRYGLGITHQRLLDQDYKHDRVFLLVDLPDVEIEDAFPIDAGLFAVYRLEGSHKDALKHYPRLMEIIREDGYTILEDAYEITLINPGIDNDSTITEIQIPIEKNRGT